MDTTAEKAQKENELRAIEQYLDHPISRKITADNTEQQDGLIDILYNVPVRDLESFFKHFEAIGHLRGLRRAKALVDDDLEEIKTKLKELQ